MLCKINNGQNGFDNICYKEYYWKSIEILNLENK